MVAASKMTSATLVAAGVLLSIMVAPPQQVEACTALAIGRKATADGSTMASHGNDCPTCDFRLTSVPSADHPKGSLDPVYFAKNDFPRLVAYGSSHIYLPENLPEGEQDFGWNMSVPIGQIPQVPHTYQYVEGSYGVMNEHQLGFGESTCDARLGDRSAPVHLGGHALFDIAALSRLSLRRCKTARCAIHLMGSMAEQHGFYGGQSTDWADYPNTPFNRLEGGEALTIIDPDEAWIFNVCPDDSGKSAVWAAQRVPDEHVAVVPNIFTIREIDLDDDEFFLASDNVHEVAIRNGFWDPKSGEPFSFQAAYRVPRKERGPRLSTFIDHRPWVIFNTIAPSRRVSPFTDPRDMPFSVKPDKPLETLEVLNLHRNVFQGTALDMSMETIAGPFGDPARGTIPRVAPINESAEYEGNFERSVSQVWTSYTVFVQARRDLPDVLGGRVWYGPHMASGTVFSLLYSNTRAMPKTLETGSLLAFDPESLWWWACLTTNYVSRFWQFGIVEVTERQREVETHLLARAEQLEKRVAATLVDSNGHSHPTEQSKTEDGAYQHALSMVTEFNLESLEYTLEKWSNFFYRLVATFHDLNHFTHAATVTTKGFVYSTWFIESIGGQGLGTAQWHQHHQDDAFERARYNPEYHQPMYRSLNNTNGLSRHEGVVPGAHYHKEVITPMKKGGKQRKHIRQPQPQHFKAAAAAAAAKTADDDDNTVDKRLPTVDSNSDHLQQQPIEQTHSASTTGGGGGGWLGLLGTGIGGLAVGLLVGIKIGKRHEYIDLGEDKDL